MMLRSEFFARDASLVARELLGKVLRRKYQNQWLSARIIETEAYYLDEKGSHASLGYTEKRKALFMPPGTIYMYYARGKDSLNVSCLGEGNAVLIKSGIAFSDSLSPESSIEVMQDLNPLPNRPFKRHPQKLCSGQTLLCSALHLKVTAWDTKVFDENEFFIDDVGINVSKIITTTRLGIPKGRDEHLMLRFVDYEFAKYCSQNPLTKRNWILGKDYLVNKQI